MDNKQKENIKRIVGEGLSQILSKLKISKTSAKLERRLKKYSKKLVDHFKDEVKRLDKKKKSAPTKSKSGRASATKSKNVSK